MIRRLLFLYSLGGVCVVQIECFQYSSFYD